MSVYHVFAKPVAASPQDARLLTEIQQQQIDESFSVCNRACCGVHKKISQEVCI
jgi:hypothetical protein